MWEAIVIFGMGLMIHWRRRRRVIDLEYDVLREAEWAGWTMRREKHCFIMHFEDDVPTCITLFGARRFPPSF